MAQWKLEGEIKNKVDTFKPDPQKDFKKAEIWLEIEQGTEFAQTVCVEFLNAKSDLIHGFQVGQKVEIDINIRGRVSNDGTRCFNSLNGWRIRGVGAAAASPPQDGGGGGEADDMPF